MVNTQKAIKRYTNVGIQLSVYNRTLIEMSIVSINKLICNENKIV